MKKGALVEINLEEHIENWRVLAVVLSGPVEHLYPESYRVYVPQFKDFHTVQKRLLKCLG